MKKKIVISIILASLIALALFIYSNNQKEEKERVERVIRWSDEYKNAKVDFESGSFDEAFAAYDRILQEHPEQDWLRLEIGDMYDDIKDYKKALGYYFDIRSPKDLNIGYRQIYLRIGGVYEEIGKIDSAIYYYNKILQAESEVDKYIGYDNDRESAFSRLGQIAFKNTDYEEAIQYLSNAIKIKRIPKALYIRANAYFLTNNLELAQKDYDESIDMIRKIYINKNPYFKNILCDTCGSFFGKKEYMAVLDEWRSFEEKIKVDNRLDSLIKSRIEYRIAIDSIPKWDHQIDSLKELNDMESIQRLNALMDSVRKYTDTTMIFNIYE
jgi:tetratricopeptide (TPR) repeat protein